MHSEILISTPLPTGQRVEWAEGDSFFKLRLGSSITLSGQASGLAFPPQLRTGLLSLASTTLLKMIIPIQPEILGDRRNVMSVNGISFEIISCPRPQLAQTDVGSHH